MDTPRMPRPGDEMTITIDTLAFGGEGIGRTLVNGNPFTVFVEETVPGDEVLVRLTKRKKNWGQAYVKQLVKPSDLRISPRCPHFGSAFQSGRPMDRSKGCGGCAWQFLSYEKQLAFKEQQVREAIRHLGGEANDVVLPIMGMGKTDQNGLSADDGHSIPWFYRNKMEFSFSRPPDGELALGLHVKGRHYDVTELRECYLMTPYTGDLVCSARDFFRMMDHEHRIDAGILLQTLTLRVGKNTGHTMLILSMEVEKLDASAEFLSNFTAWAKDFFASLSLPLTSLMVIEILNKPGQRKIFREKVLAGSSTILEALRLPGRDSKNGHEVESLNFTVSAPAFFQPNTYQAEKLYQIALESAELSGDEVVYDLFCGTGTIGIFCSKRARKVYGIELNPDAIENARTNANLNGITNIEFLVGDVGKHLPRLPEKPDVMIVDPPRGGLEPKVVEKILEFAPRRLVYVSCNPSTLARDLKLFCAEKYRLESVQPVDMFPHTYHIENVARLSLV